MAVMSFAHLKKKTQPEVKAVQGVMSFAHLKRQPKPAADVQENKPPVARRAYRIPAVMMTARLSAVNYCRGCGRFLPASEWEKENGNSYGRCLRSGEIDSEENMELWKVIPAKATVARCYFFIIQQNR